MLFKIDSDEKTYLHKNVIKNHLLAYPTPANLNYSWGYGSLLGLFLVIQIFSGILLAMHYTPHISLAFSSVEHIVRDLNNGWLCRYVHINGASFLFMFLYLHIFRNIIYSSYAYPYHILWYSGVLLFVLMMATAYIGYVLPFGQMSFWGATVIINLFTTIPIWGDSLVYWILGGFSVDNSTLNRFFSLHYLVPFLILGVVFVHLTLLHLRGSNNPLGSSSSDKVTFYPYFYFKDALVFFFFFFSFLFIIFFYPNLFFLRHTDNFNEANPLVTPAHIVPEWYFLPFYAMLRSIPSKVGGVVCMALSILIFFFLPRLRAFGIYIFEFLAKKEYILKLEDYDNKMIKKCNENVSLTNNFVLKNYFLARNYGLIFPTKMQDFYNVEIQINSPQYRTYYSYACAIFVWNLMWLAHVGGHPVDIGNIILGSLGTFIHFFFFLVLVPLIYFFEYLSINYYANNPVTREELDYFYNDDIMLFVFNELWDIDCYNFFKSNPEIDVDMTIGEVTGSDTYIFLDKHEIYLYIILHPYLEKALSTTRFLNYINGISNEYSITKWPEYFALSEKKYILHSDFFKASPTPFAGMYSAVLKKN